MSYRMFRSVIADLVSLRPSWKRLLERAPVTILRRLDATDQEYSNPGLNHLYPNRAASPTEPRAIRPIIRTINDWLVCVPPKFPPHKILPSGLVDNPI